MRIEELVAIKSGPPEMMEKIRNYVQSRSDLAFSSRDQELVKEFGLKPATIASYLWSLAKSGLLHEERVNRGAYFMGDEAHKRFKDCLKAGVH
jgi:DNA-binding transcriptional regulator PaaX